MAENTLYALATCGHCREILTALADHPAWAAKTEVVYVNEPAGYKRMQADGIFQTPTLVTRDGQVISSPRSSYIWFANTYGE